MKLALYILVYDFFIFSVLFD